MTTPIFPPVASALQPPTPGRVGGASGGAAGGSFVSPSIPTTRRGDAAGENADASRSDLQADHLVKVGGTAAGDTSVPAPHFADDPVRASLSHEHRGAESDPILPGTSGEVGFTNQRTCRRCGHAWTVGRWDTAHVCPQCLDEERASIRRGDMS